MVDPEFSTSTGDFVSAKSRTHHWMKWGEVARTGKIQSDSRRGDLGPMGGTLFGSIDVEDLKNIYEATYGKQADHAVSTEGLIELWKRALLGKPW